LAFFVAWVGVIRLPSVVLLEHLPGWRRVYADALAVVHVRMPPR
jgi:hypothetical protein